MQNALPHERHFSQDVTPGSWRKRPITGLTSRKSLKRSWRFWVKTDTIPVTHKKDGAPVNFRAIKPDYWPAKDITTSNWLHLHLGFPRMITQETSKSFWTIILITNHFASGTDPLNRIADMNSVPARDWAASRWRISIAFLPTGRIMILSVTIYWIMPMNWSTSIGM